MDKMTYLGKANGKPFASQSTAQYYMTTHGINGTVVPAEGYGFVVRTSNGASQDKTRVFTPDRVKDPSVSKEQEIQYEDIPWMQEDPSPQPEAQEVPEANAGNQEDYEQYAQARQKGKLSNAPNRKLTPEESEKWLDKHSGTISDVLGVPEKESVPEKSKKPKKKKKKKPIERSSIQDLFKGTEFEDFKKSDDFGSFDTRQRDIYEWLSDDKSEDEKEETSFAAPAPIPEIKRRAFTEGEFLGKEGGMSSASTGVGSHDNFSGRVFDADPFIQIEDKRTKGIVEHSKEVQDTPKEIQKIHEGEFLGKEGGLESVKNPNSSGRIFEGTSEYNRIGSSGGSLPPPPTPPKGGEQPMDDDEHPRGTKKAIFDPLYKDYNRFDDPQDDKSPDAIEGFVKNVTSAGKALSSFAAVLKVASAVAEQTTHEKEGAARSGLTRTNLAGILNSMADAGLRQDTSEKLISNAAQAGQRVQQDPSSLGGMLSRLATANALSGGAKIDFGSISNMLLTQDTAGLIEEFQEHAEATRKKFKGKKDGDKLAERAIAATSGVFGLQELTLAKKGIKDVDAKRDSYTENLESASINLNAAKVSLLGGDFSTAFSQAFNAASAVVSPLARDQTYSDKDLKEAKTEGDRRVMEVINSGTPYAGMALPALQGDDALTKLGNWFSSLLSDDKSSATKNLGAPSDSSKRELDLHGRAVVKVSLIDDKTGQEVGKGTAEMQSAKTVNKFN